MTGLESFDTGVDLSGLMAVLSQHLYSTPDVAIRELVQNAHDSVTRRQMLDSTAPASSISVVTDEAARRLEFCDNGAGLTRDEIHEHLATVGVGGTRELREQTNSDDLIGMFGLGFLSAFVVADEVTVTTTSFRSPDQTWQYRSFDGFRYTLLPAEPGPVGTVVTLHLSPGYEDLASPAMADAVLRRYCRLLPHPVRLDDQVPVNLAPPWRSGTEATARVTDGADDALSFALAFETRFEPLAAIPVHTDTGWLEGMLWIHGGSTYGNADNRQLSAYVRGMLLADNDIDLLPRWAGFVSGVVESPNLTPTASRETLQRDSSYTEAQIAMAESLTSGLADLARDRPRVWQRILRRHGEALLGAAITDDRLFELVADQVEVPTSQGTRHVAGLRSGRRIYASTGSERGFEEVLFNAIGLPIARGDRYGVLPFLRRYADRHGLELVEVGTDDGNAALFAPAPLADDDRQWLQRELAGPDEAIVAVTFDPTSMPLVVIPDRTAELKQRLERDDLDRAAGSAVAGLARLHTAGIEDRPPVGVHVNMSCPTINHLLAARHHNPVGATRATSFLRTIKTLMAAADRDRGGDADLRRAFDDALAVLDGLLLPTEERPT